MEEFLIIRDKINLIISEDKMYAVDFQPLLDELNQIGRNFFPIQNSNFLVRIINTIRAKLTNPDRLEFDEDSFNKLKERAIELYCEKVLKKKHPIQIHYQEGEDAYCTYTYGINHNRILNEIKKLQIIVTRLSKSPNGKYEVYPWTLSKEKLEEAVNQEYREISRLYLTTTKNEYEIIKERENALIKEYEKAKSLFMQSDIEPYYGTPKFIQKRSQYILECMEEILAAQDVKPENKKKAAETIEKVRELVDRIDGDCNNLNSEQRNQKYDKIRENFQELLKIEDDVSADIVKIWNEFLTNPNDYKEGKRFAFLIHMKTNTDFTRLDNRNKVCCTLATEKCMPLEFSNVGYICELSKDNIGIMCTEDACSWLISKAEFFESQLQVNRQFAESAGLENEDRIYYEEPKISKLILPSKMESIMVANNINSIKKSEETGDIQHPQYTEILLRGKIPIIAMVCTNEKGREIVEKLARPIVMLNPEKGTSVQFRDAPPNIYLTHPI